MQPMLTDSCQAFSSSFTKTDSNSLQVQQVLHLSELKSPQAIHLAMEHCFRSSLHAETVPVAR